MIILGSKFYTHDSAAYCIDTNAKTIFAASTERITRAKHDDIPVSVLHDLLPEADIDIVSHSYNDFGPGISCQENLDNYPMEQVNRYIEWQKATLGPAEYAALCGPAGEHPLLAFAKDLQRQKQRDLNAGVPLSVANRKSAETFIRRFIEPCRVSNQLKVETFNHHLCHAVSAYYSSPYYPRPCAVVTLDGHGDGDGGKVYIFRGDFHQEIGNLSLPITDPSHEKQLISLGLLYQNFTAVAGFREGWDEGKVEALAAFGQPVPALYRRLKDACLIADNGIHILPDRIKPFFDRAALAEEAKTHGIENLCATIQKFLEDIVVQFINELSLPNDIDCLCLAGGVAANVIMNMAIFERTRFKKIHVTPYMADEGTACGAAILAAKLYGQDVSWIPQHIMPYFGPAYRRDEVRNVLQKRSADIAFTDMDNNWHTVAAEEIADGRIVALFQGKMEFGPRALGNRSILANPADPSFRERINVSIKRRPPWQPFCPSVLESERTRLFEDSFHHKHMAIAFRMKPEIAAALPSAVHIDGTARPQFVTEEDNPSYYRLLEEVKKITGYGIIINTSFNLHGRAMVMKPEHAIDDFLDCNLDTLFIEGFRVTRSRPAIS